MDKLIFLIYSEMNGNPINGTVWKSVEHCGIE